MKTNKELGFVKGRMRAGLIAFKGAYLFVTTEHSAMVQSVLALLITLFGFYMGLSPIEWMFHVVVWCMVLIAEALNTTVEKICDFIHPDYSSKIGFIKDVGAGAVWFAALAALIVELFIFVPKI